MCWCIYEWFGWEEYEYCDEVRCERILFWLVVEVCKNCRNNDRNVVKGVGENMEVDVVYVFIVVWMVVFVRMIMFVFVRVFMVMFMMVVVVKCYYIY